MPTEVELDLLDAAAMAAHDGLDTRPAHRMLTRQIWYALRELGVTHGWVTCIGMDAATFTGHVSPEEYGDPGSFAEWLGPILPASEFYDSTLQPQEALGPQSENDPPVDVVIANLPYADLHLRSQHGVMRVRQVHEELLGGAVEHTAPGGFLVVLTSRHLMDDKDTGTRRALLQDVDLLGALRLPGTTYHPAQAPEQTAPTDLLVLQRRRSGVPDRTAPWIHTGPVVFPGGEAVVNGYFTTHYPHHVVGKVGFVTNADREVPRMTVLPSSEELEPALRVGLSQIVREARANRSMTASPAQETAPATRTSDVTRTARRPPREQHDRTSPAPGV